MPTYSLLLLPMAMIIIDGWTRQVHIASTHVSISVFPELMLRGRDINWTGSRQTPFQYNLQCKLRLFLATVMTLKKKIVCIFISITHNREREIMNMEHCECMCISCPTEFVIQLALDGKRKITSNTIANCPSINGQRFIALLSTPEHDHFRSTTCNYYY